MRTEAGTRATTAWEVAATRAVEVADQAARSVTGDELVSPAWLEAAAAWIGEVTLPWEALTGLAPATRAYRCLVSSLHLEAWVIVWPRDGHLQLHDHGGANGALHVVDGVLEERSLAPTWAAGDPGPVLRRRSLEAGAALSFDGAYIHDVRNLEPEPATSVHVYSAAARPMAFYGLDGGLVRSVGAASSEALREVETAAEARAAGAGGADRFRSRP